MSTSDPRLDPMAGGDSDPRSARIDAILRSVIDDPRTHRTSATPTPDASMVASLVDRFLWLAFPGFFGPRIDAADSPAGLRRLIAALVEDITGRLHPQLVTAFAYEAIDGGGCSPSEARRRTDATIERLVDAVPGIRRLLASDAEAGFAGDPAVVHPDEAILCHPGLRALVVHRFAHELHAAGVPLLPRMLSEISHAHTGIDLHPGATIGGSCFIDHGTGVVVGETTVIGERCTLYQGVTLGAKRFERKEDGEIRRGYRRHPTLEDEVTVYAGATILGGDTVVGRGSVVNGGVFLVQSVPPDSIVSGPRLDIQLRSR
ncbi:MAG: serine acetyltransferase [Phycisphaerae bacterium]|nr:serine acetyltransferase [Phycisphaerae bacterium]